MKRLLPILILFVVTPILAATTQVEVTIQAVKAEAKKITVTYNTNLGEKSITLDVGGKAQIILNGEEATLESLESGQKATVEYNRELQIVTKIVIATETLAEKRGNVKVPVKKGDMSFSELLAVRNADPMTGQYVDRATGKVVSPDPSVGRSTGGRTHVGKKNAATVYGYIRVSPGMRKVYHNGLSQMEKEEQKGFVITNSSHEGHFQAADLDKNFDVTHHYLTANREISKAIMTELVNAEPIDGTADVYFRAKIYYLFPHREMEKYVAGVRIADIQFLAPDGKSWDRWVVADREPEGKKKTGKP